jgi:hypothetical protein
LGFDSASDSGVEPSALGLWRENLEHPGETTQYYSARILLSAPNRSHLKKIGTQEIDQNLLIRLRRGGAVVPELRASFRWYVRFLQRKLTERALQKDGNGDGPAAGVMRQTILPVESELKQIDKAIAVALSLDLSLEAESWPARLQGKQRA